MINRRRGFTIVELLIVIVVIGILAAITIVAYNGIQQRAQDSKIVSSANQIAKALQVWSLKTGKTTDVGGSGSTAFTNGVCVGGSGGWISSNISTYSCTVENILVASGDLPADLVDSMPSTNLTGKVYYKTLMLYGCPTSYPANTYVMMYALNTPRPDEITNIRTACAGGPTNTYGPIDTYGMNGGFTFRLSS